MTTQTETKTDARIPPGVVGVVIDAEGRVIASGTDFHPDRPGGCAIYVGQQWRLDRVLMVRTLDAYCSPIVSQSLDQYVIEQVFRQVRQKHRLRILYVPIGHGPEATEHFDDRNRDR